MKCLSTKMRLVKWSVSDLIEACHQPCIVEQSVDTLVEQVIKHAKPGDTLLVMSNGGFGGIHEKLLQQLAG